MIRCVVAVGLVLALAPSAGAASPKPCTLLTNAEVAKAIGSKVASKETMNFNGSPRDTCKWTGVNLAGPKSYATHRTLMIAVDAESRSSFLKFAKQVHGAVRVKGIGQIAFSQGNGNLTVLEIWHDGHSIEVIANLVTNPLAVEKTAAQAALARL